MIVISVFLVTYWILYGQRKQKELLSQNVKTKDQGDNDKSKL